MSQPTMIADIAVRAAALLPGQWVCEPVADVDALDLATALGSSKGKGPTIQGTKSPGVLLRGPGGARLYMAPVRSHRGRLRRIAVGALLPQVAGSPRACVALSTLAPGVIYVDATRRPSGIAAATRTRLLPSYLDVLAEAHRLLEIEATERIAA
ncbi:hypothetical protein OG689_41640 [Kitasatospora sp. NBC_00240]|uniref:hypothetical protein n=1 Tax=Kitasatospora sp. NBC_00240 TaxID=2903567 RepID=UPI00224CC7C9|nr:hypothetical protein [Kitasatospora sp. NBC_00240]MCX5215661.1 hypothetical protein [Kitasatospora sp. NBC_00240]